MAAPYDGRRWCARRPRGGAQVAGPIDAIKNLSRGEEIEVVQADGTVAAFAVDGVQKVAKTTFPSSAVYGNVPYPGLRLVTCGGPFDAAAGQYQDNIVVYAHLTGVAA